MEQYNLPEPFDIPFFDDEQSLRQKIKSSSSRRNMSILFFSFRKVKNILYDRIAYFCPINSWRLFFHRRRGVHIGKGVYIGVHCSLDNAYPEMIFIEDHVSISPGSTIIAHTMCRKIMAGIVPSRVEPVLIKKYVGVALNCIILPGVTIGEYSIVSSGAVISKSIPPFTIVSNTNELKSFNFKRLMRHID